MRKHGFDNFVLESVEKFSSEDETYENEAKTIQRLLSENIVLYLVHAQLVEFYQEKLNHRQCQLSTNVG